MYDQVLIVNRQWALTPECEYGNFVGVVMLVFGIMFHRQKIHWLKGVVPHCAEVYFYHITVTHMPPRWCRSRLDMSGRGGYTLSTRCSRTDRVTKCWSIVVITPRQSAPAAPTVAIKLHIVRPNEYVFCRVLEGVRGWACEKWGDWGRGYSRGARALGLVGDRINDKVQNLAGANNLLWLSNWV